MRFLPHLLLLGAVLEACSCDPLELEGRRFACARDEDCLDGFVCRNVGSGLECVAASSLDAGARDAGLADAGVDGGMPADDGGLDAGLDGGPDGGVDGGLSFGPVPSSILAGTCVPVELQAGASGSGSEFTLTVTPPTAARFSTQATCSDTIQSIRVPPGETSVRFFVKTISGGQTRVSASSAGLGTADTLLPTTPAVRRGVCQLPASQVLPDGGSDGVGLSKTCSFSPPVTDLGHSFLLIQPVTASLLLTGSAQVTCRLSANDAITCARVQDADPVIIHFQVAELPEGLRVVRPPATYCAELTSIDAGLADDKTMLLKTSSSVSTFYDDDDSPVVFFEAPDTLFAGAPCSRLHVQLLEWAGASVTRGVWDAGVIGAEVELTGLSPTGPNTIVSSQTHTPDAVNDVCAMLLRPTLTSPTSLKISRNAGLDGGCVQTPFPGLGFERIDFGRHANVQQLEVRVAPNQVSPTFPIRAVDLSRALVMTSSQTVAGQGNGETDLADPRNYTTAMAAFSFVSGSQVQVVRSEITRSAAFTVYVIELNP